MLNRPVVCKLLKNKKENTQSERQREFIAKKQFNDISEICKYKITYRHWKFQCKGHHVDTECKNKKSVKKHTINHLKQNRESDKLSLFGQRNSFEVGK